MPPIVQALSISVEGFWHRSIPRATKARAGAARHWGVARLEDADAFHADASCLGIPGNEFGLRDGGWEMWMGC